METDPALPTGTVTVGLDDRGVPAFTVHGPVAWDAIEGPDPVPTHETLCFGTLPMRGPRSRAALERLLVGSTGLRAGDANLRDPDDPVTRIITTERVAVLKDEYGTKPHVFYLGLDENVR